MTPTWSGVMNICSLLSKVIGHRICYTMDTEHDLLLLRTAKSSRWCTVDKKVIHLFSKDEMNALLFTHLYVEIKQGNICVSSCLLYSASTYYQQEKVFFFVLTETELNYFNYSLLSGRHPPHSMAFLDKWGKIFQPPHLKTIYPSLMT